MMPYKHLVDEREFSHSTRKLLSLICLVIAATIGFMTFTCTKWLFFTDKCSLAPGLISAPIAIAFVLPLYLRGILRWSSSVFGLLSFALFTSVFASLISLAVGGTISNYLLAAAIVLSWGGMRGIAGLSWALVLGSVVVRATDIGTAMGPFGFVMVLSAFVGLLLHAQLSPAQLFAEIIREFCPEATLNATTTPADRLPTGSGSANTTSI
jgi:hypothetical protein